MTVYVSSDHHLGHERICELADRPWETAGEMNEALIANHNQVVQPDDLVFIVGDVVLGKLRETLPLVSHLNGIKGLVVGNHDGCHPSKKGHAGAEAKYLEHFQWVSHSTVLHLSDWEPVDLCHFPYRPDQYDPPRGQEDGDRWADYRIPDEGGWLLHGHTHNPSMFSGPRQLHIGVDADWTDYGVERYHPIPLTAIEAAVADLTRH